MACCPRSRRAFLQREIADASFRYQRETDRHERTIVGVNDHVTTEPVQIPILDMDPEGYRRQVARLDEVRRTRDGHDAARALHGLEQACRGGDNVMPHLIEAVSAYATLQECCDVMRDVFGAYTEAAVV